jgi:hypothetical protein
MIPVLSLLETRVLGVLVEKELTVPDIYPLSLNALTSGCNQKNNREPVMAATEAEVQAAIDRLKPLSLVIESSGSRVMRYSQNIGRVLRVPSEAVAVLATLWLRGPQTAAEIRAASERLHRFADVSSSKAICSNWPSVRRTRVDRWLCCCRAAPARVSRAGRTCCRGRSMPPRNPATEAQSPKCPRTKWPRCAPRSGGSPTKSWPCASCCTA